MDLQKFVDSFDSATCLISVKKTEGGYEDIRIAAANKKFVDLIESPAENERQIMIEEKFVPNSAYYKYIPKDAGFEDVCYRCAVLKKPVHTYAHVVRINLWFNIFALPIGYEDGDVCYCAYTLEVCDLTEIDLISTHYSKTTSDVLKTCIKLHGTDDFNKTLTEVIKDIRLICDANVCTLMLVDFSTGTCSVLATDIKEGSTLKRVTQFKNFYDIAISWLDTIGDSDCLIIKDERDMEYISKINNPWYKTLVEAKVDSVVMFPLRHNNEVMGFIWATNFDTRDTMRIKDTLELTTFFISSEIASYKMMKSLEYISYTDMLTGIRNSNSLNDRIKAVAEGREKLDAPFGVVFCDLNGLKAVNDTEGHSAGDLLLKKAALLLMEIFTGDSIYRAGGDEFTVISSGGSKEEFTKKADMLRARSNDPNNVCISVGAYFAEADCSLQKAMELADEDMYKEKKVYYEMYPEIRH